MTMLKIKLTNDFKLPGLLEELKHLKLNPNQHYVIHYSKDPWEPFLEFKDPKYELLWRVAVGYKYI
jgi:hypothetical protein